MWVLGVGGVYGCSIWVCGFLIKWKEFIFEEGVGVSLVK